MPRFPAHPGPLAIRIGERPMSGKTMARRPPAQRSRNTRDRRRKAPQMEMFASGLSSAGGFEMNRKRSKPKIDRRMPMVHPNAAAIDVWATMDMAAVRAERTPEPVRSFGTFTTDLHRLVN